MNIFQSIQSLREHLAPLRMAGTKIALVTTMGNLHEGHLALVRHAKQVADHIVVSIFVNPLQFAPHEDFDTYPRTQQTDIDKLIASEVDSLFLPDNHEIYPNNQLPLSQVIVPGLSDALCGKTRPHFFYGVTTVVAKLFHIVQPQIAIFGEKDFQQWVIICRMVQDLNFPITILPVATVREADGLAMSSRNQYLNVSERAIAPDLFANLNQVCEQIIGGNLDYPKLCQQAGEELEKLGFKLDYLEVRNSASLEIPKPNDTALVVLAAAWLGKTRLIDNVRVEDCR